MDTIHTIGRRKSAVARIYMSKGKGNITVNNRESDKYFTTATLIYKLNHESEIRKRFSSFNLLLEDGEYISFTDWEIFVNYIVNTKKD